MRVPPHGKPRDLSTTRREIRSHQKGLCLDEAAMGIQRVPCMLHMIHESFVGLFSRRPMSQILFLLFFGSCFGAPGSLEIRMSGRQTEQDWIRLTTCFFLVVFECCSKFNLSNLSTSAFRGHGFGSSKDPKFVLQRTTSRPFCIGEELQQIEMCIFQKVFYVQVRKR